MKTIKHTLLYITLLFVALSATSCLTERSEAIDNLCEGFWFNGDDSITHLHKFDEKGNVFYYVYQYEAAEDKFYAYYDTSRSKHVKYYIDTENSQICFLPDLWYDIYMITKNTLIFGNVGEENSTFTNVNNKVNVMKKEDFLRKYPKNHTVAKIAKKP